MSRLSIRAILTTTIVATALSTKVGFADVNSDANALFVEAVHSWSDAAAIHSADLARRPVRLELLERVAYRLDQIITDLPGSDLAVRLITGETVGPLTLESAQAALAQIKSETESQSCDVTPSPTCILDEALAVAMSETDRIVRGDLFLEVSLAMARSGDPDRALALSLENVVPHLHTLVNREILRALVLAGRNEDAMNLAGGDLPDWLLAEAVRGHFVRQRLDLAEATTASISSPIWKASAFATVGMVSEAFTLAQDSIEDDKNKVMLEIAIAFANAGQIDAALEAFDLVSDDQNRFETRRQIALAQIRVGLVADAIELVF